MSAGCTHWPQIEVGGEVETIPAETIPADKDVLALVIRVTEAPALNCWSCSMYEWMKLQGSWVHEMEMNMIDYEYSYSQPSLRFVLPLVLV